MIDLTEMIKEQKRDISRKTCSVKEFAEMINASENKARQLTHAQGFPVIVLGKKRLIVLSKVDEWLERNIGSQF